MLKHIKKSVLENCFSTSLKWNVCYIEMCVWGWRVSSVAKVLAEWP